MHMLIIMRLKFRLIIRQKDDLRHTYWCRSDCSREGSFLTLIHQLNKIYEHISIVGMKLRFSYKLLSQEQRGQGFPGKCYHHAWMIAIER